MAGGIGYVLDRVIKQGKDSATKGAYSFTKGPRSGTYQLTHYGTKILLVDRGHKTVSGGWDTVSSSGAINQALNALSIPCYWARSQKAYGFWCNPPWTGDPSGPKHVEDLLKEKEARKKQRRELTVKGGKFRIPGHKYSKYAIKRMEELQERETKRW